MKRKIAILLTLVCVLSSMAIPAMASTIYTGVGVNPFMDIEEFQMVGDIGSGYYHVRVYNPSGNLSGYTVEPVYFDANVENTFCDPNNVMSISASGNESTGSYTFSFYSPNGKLSAVTYGRVSGSDFGRTYAVDWAIELELVSQDSSSSEETEPPGDDVGNDFVFFLSDYFDVNTFDGVFNDVVSLIPVVLVALVSFIGIRKGIRFLQDYIHKA